MGLGAIWKKAGSKPWVNLVLEVHFWPVSSHKRPVLGEGSAGDAAHPERRNLRNPWATWFFRDKILVHILWCHGKHRNPFRSILLHEEKEKQVYPTAKQLVFILKKIWLNQSDLFYFSHHGVGISLYNEGIFSNMQIKEYNSKIIFGFYRTKDTQTFIAKSSMENSLLFPPSR